MRGNWHNDLLAPRRLRGVKKFNFYWRNYIVPGIIFLGFMFVLSILAAILQGF